jgi:serine protease AprX
MRPGKYLVMTAVRLLKVVTGLATTVGLAAAGLAPVPASASTATAGTTTIAYHSELGPDGKIILTQTVVPVTVRNIPLGTKPAEPAPKPVSKLDPRLAAMADDMSTASGSQRVVVTFYEDRKIPRFPDLDPALPRTASVNVEAQARSDAIVDNVTAQRRAGYQALSTDLAQLGVRTLGTYWLFKGMVVDAPVSALAALAQRDDVSYVGPVETGAPPPADADPDNDEEDARALMRSDPLFSSTSQTGFIGILDTGVRASHTLFNNPSKPWIRQDLTNLANPNPDDDCWNHGTSTAAILTGNANLGNAFRGVTGITVDSFKVYPANCGGLDSDAAALGFQHAVQVGDRVIVAEMQGVENENGGLAAAADGAFDAGAVVIAANGNNGPGSGTVNAPAVAQKVLGIGSVDLKTLTTPSSQSLGPAPDGRIKPDLQAPTNVETASNASDTATQVFTGTSAATPHAAGAAALLRSALGGGGAVDPGRVYAHMIANGSLTYPFSNTNGAGLVRLPVAGSTLSLPQTISNRQTFELPLPLGQPDVNQPISMAIWWPEQPATHNDIDLSLVDPNGFVRASSVSIGGVFERVSLSPQLAGTWTVRITGFNVPSGSQLVYLSVIMAR